MLGFGWPEILLVALVGFFVFGPERLPDVARDLTRMIRTLRNMAQGATDDLKAYLPEASEFGLQDYSDLRQLHPKNMVAGLFSDDQAYAQAAATVPAASSQLTGVAPPRVEMTVPAGGVPPYDVDAT